MNLASQRLYCEFYEVSHPVEHPPLFKRLKERITSQVRRRWRGRRTADKKPWQG